MEVSMRNESNYVRVRGRVLRDETARRVRSGLRIIDFALAVEDTDGDRDVYVDCYGTNETCDTLGGFVSAGEELLVDGHMTFRTFTTNTGQRRSGVVVFVENVIDYDEEPMGE